MFFFWDVFIVIFIFFGGVSILKIFVLIVIGFKDFNNMISIIVICNKIFFFIERFIGVIFFFVFKVLFFFFIFWNVYFFYFFLFRWFFNFNYFFVFMIFLIWGLKFIFLFFVVVLFYSDVFGRINLKGGNVVVDIMSKVYLLVVINV